MEESKHIQTIEQKTVLFYEDELIAVRGNDENIYVSVRHLCDVLGLNRRGQVQRIHRNTVLSRGYRSGSLQTEGGVQTAGLLRVDLLPLWLTGLSTKAIRPVMKPRLDRYQDEAAKVLWEAFQSGRLTADPSFDEILNSESPAAQAYKMAQAMMELARNQLLLESRLDGHEELLVDHGQRLEQMEVTLGDPGRHVTADQAMQISQAVKMIAMELSKRTKKNEYGAVYGQLYRQFAVTSYKQLPSSQFDGAMEWLTDWYKRITGATGPDEVPF